MRPEIIAKQKLFFHFDSLLEWCVRIYWCFCNFTICKFTIAISNAFGEESNSKKNRTNTSGTRIEREKNGE